MESKVLLYNSNDIKIGETFARRARQLVNRQRAEWVDDNHSAIRFYFGMENMDNNKTNDFDKTDDFNDNEEIGVCINHLCFARWTDGKYYPAVVSDIVNNHVKVAYLDGDTGMVLMEHVIELYEAFDTLTFQGDWKGWGYYSGVLSNTEPLIMEYDDGDVEQVYLKQLRGIRR